MLINQFITYHFLVENIKQSNLVKSYFIKFSISSKLVSGYDSFEYAKYLHNSIAFS